MAKSESKYAAESLPTGYERKRCASCSRIRPCLFREDPGPAELWGNHTKIWLCDECEYTSRMDV